MLLLDYWTVICSSETEGACCEGIETTNVLGLNLINKLIIHLQLESEFLIDRLEKAF